MTKLIFIPNLIKKKRSVDAANEAATTHSTLDEPSKPFVGRCIPGIKLAAKKWDENGTVDLSTPGHVQKALQRHCYPQPSKPEHSFAPIQ